MVLIVYKIQHLEIVFFISSIEEILVRKEPKRLRYSVLKREILSAPGAFYRAIARGISRDKEAYYASYNGIGRAMRLYNQLILYHPADLRWVTEELMRRCPNDKFELFDSEETEKAYIEKHPDYKPRELFPGMNYMEAYEFVMKRCTPYKLKDIFKYYHSDIFAMVHDDDKDDPDFRYPRHSISSQFFMDDQGRFLRLVFTGNIPREAWRNEREFDYENTYKCSIPLEKSVEIANGRSLNELVDDKDAFYYLMVLDELRSIMYQAGITSRKSSEWTTDAARKYNQAVYDIYAGDKEHLQLYMLKKYWNQAMMYLVYAPGFIRADIKRIKTKTTTEGGVYCISMGIERFLRISTTIDDMEMYLGRGDSSGIYEYANDDRTKGRNKK